MTAMFSLSGETKHENDKADSYQVGKFFKMNRIEIKLNRVRWSETGECGAGGS